MSYCNRLYKLAIRGLLIGVFLWAASGLAQEAQQVRPPLLESQPVSESGQNTGKEQREKRGQKEKPPAEKLAPALNKIESAIRDLITQQSSPQSEPPKDNEIRDLEAQEGMALWAKRMFWATLAAVVVTFMGIVLIGFTLFHTKRAADFAGHMVDEAKATTQAAKESIKSTRISAERQLRAYVSIDIERMRFNPKSRKFEINYLIKNVGQTPAHNVQFGAGMELCPHPLVDEPELLPSRDSIKNDASKSIAVLQPGQFRRGGKESETTFRNSAEVAAIGIGGKRFYIPIAAYYEDVFEEERYSRFCVTIPTTELQRAFNETGGHIMPECVHTAKNNDAT